MYETVDSQNGSEHPNPEEMSLLISQRDGQVVGQSHTARALLGSPESRPCWSMMRRVPGHDRLPCAEGCVKALLLKDEGCVSHSITLLGRAFELRCEPVGDQVVTTLRPQPEKATDDSQRLTPREIEVLQLLAEGLEGGEIADRLGICVGTVRTHVEHMRASLDIRTRAGLVAKGYQLRYLR